MFVYVSLKLSLVSLMVHISFSWGKWAPNYCSHKWRQEKGQEQKQNTEEGRKEAKRAHGNDNDPLGPALSPLGSVGSPHPGKERQAWHPVDPSDPRGRVNHSRCSSRSGPLTLPTSLPLMRIYRSQSPSLTHTPHTHTHTHPPCIQGNCGPASGTAEKGWK